MLAATPMRRRPGIHWAPFLVLTLAAAGCNEAAQPERRPPIANAQVEIRTLPSSHPDPSADATCQTGAIVRLMAGGSVDPAGGALVYEWLDTVQGVPTADFRPRPNPLQLTEPEVGTGLYTMGEHEIRLTVRAPDGRKASTTLRVLVTSCEDCGG